MELRSGSLTSNSRYECYVSLIKLVKIAFPPFDVVYNITCMVIFLIYNHLDLLCYENHIYDVEGRLLVSCVQDLFGLSECHLRRFK